MNPKTLLALLWILSAVATLMLILSCATNYWATYSTLQTREGIWQKCTGQTCTNVDIGDRHSTKFKVIRALVVIGVIASVLTNVVFGVGYWRDQDYTVGLIILEVVLIGSYIAALGIYSVDIKLHFYSFGWSYMLGWFGVFLFIVETVVLSVMLCRS